MELLAAMALTLKQGQIWLVACSELALYQSTLCSFKHSELDANHETDSNQG